MPREILSMNSVVGALLAIALLGCKPARESASARQTANKTDSVIFDRPESPSNQYSSTEHAWFALADSTGTRLICEGPDTLPEGPFFLARMDGAPAPLEYTGHQKQSSDWDFRDVARNFDLLGGHVFKSPATLAPDHTYLVVTKDFLEEHRPVPAIAGNCQPIDNTSIAHFPFAEQRRVHAAWKLASLDQREIASVWYEGNPPLAAFVVAKGDSTLSQRFVGDASGDSTSVWRVDDGGEFNGCNLEILAAFTSSRGMEFARTWAGVEGESAEFLVQSADTFATLFTGSRYWSPL